AQKKEKEIINEWEKSGYNNPEKTSTYLKQNGYTPQKSFVMTLPPPNANGDLHIGHTCGYSFQDLMGRYHRMHGRPTLLIPGKDHASIQTEAVFVRLLEKRGESKWELGREKFYEKCYEFCMKNSENARTQEKRIGLSADWSREFFTLDERLTKVIYDTFFKMFEDGLIYRGEYIINQCPHCRTALADIDTVHKESRGIMAEIIYPFADKSDEKIAEDIFQRYPIEIKDADGKIIEKRVLSSRGITVATTRPETMLGDSAVAVNPNDSRYKEFIGKKVILPIANREIEIIADDDVDTDFGTGALKVTPAHSPVDFKIGKKHGLDTINVIDPDGKMCEPAPGKYIGMDSVECSKALVKDLDELGLLVSMKNFKHEVIRCERCDTPIQHIISKQWFVDVKPLADAALKSLQSGETTIIPDGQQKALVHFFENIEPWCISRQLWWGQDIPVWYSGGKELYDYLLDRIDEGETVNTLSDERRAELLPDGARGSGKIFVQVEKPESDPAWRGNPSDLYFEKDEDVLDTWFSSGQWPFSTLGGPGGEDYQKYYPTDVMETAQDILFWWVARMMMLGIYRTGKSPFKDVYLHGMILAQDGSKMSKSKNNGVSPIETIEEFGADALRMWYYTDTLAGSSSPIRMEKIKGNRNFVNKIWNAFRFVLMNIDESEIAAIRELIDRKDAFEGDEYIEALNDSNSNIDRNFGKFRFNLAAEEIREFFWHTVCDKWIEEVKSKIDGLDIGDEGRVNELAKLFYVMREYLKIMHPFVPFITEAVWSELRGVGLVDGLLIIAQRGE
ncbi:MAG TPA: valine--tRNA ligase, partial [bacterium]|nr:valine--tRNA ligase [bacterium]